MPLLYAQHASESSCYNESSCFAASESSCYNESSCFAASESSCFAASESSCYNESSCYAGCSLRRLCRANLLLRYQATASYDNLSYILCLVPANRSCHSGTADLKLITELRLLSRSPTYNLGHPIPSHPIPSHPNLSKTAQQESSR